MISAYTTIGEMYRLGLISAQVKDVCFSGKIKTLDQLLNSKIESLRRISGCRKKTFDELVDVQRRYSHYLPSYLIDGSEQVELLNAQKKIELLSSNSLEQLNGWITSKFNTLSVRAKNAFPQLSQLSSLIELIYSLQKFNIMEVRNIGNKTCGEIQSYLNEFKAYFEEISLETLQSYQSNNDEDKNIIDEQVEILNAQKKIDRLTPHSLLKLKEWINSKFKTLSIRAKNGFPQLSQLSSLIDILYSVQEFNPQKVENIGNKTCGEIQSYLSEFKAHFEEITKGIDPKSDVPNHNEFDLLVAQVEELYPFLLTKECEMVAKHISTHDFIPILFIAKQYILRCEDSRMNIYKDYYGFNSEGRRYTISEIGKKNNLSRERIRQLVGKKINLPKSFGDEIHRYLTRVLESIVPFDSLLWNKVQRDNMLEEPYSHTALLACSVTDTYTIIQIDNNDKEYLVNKELIENVKIKNVLSNIIRVINLRRTTIDRLDILDYIKVEKRVYHKNVDLLGCIYANYLSKNYNVNVEDNRYVMILPNAIDISIAIEDILEQFGEPMSLEEIKQAFNALYPSNSIEDIAKFKPYILKNANIKSKGKTGIYILKSWNNHFTGTLTSYLVHILHTFNEPIPLDDLVDFALDEFPRSNKKSIYSLIIGDKDNRFIVYEKDYIGLAENNLSEIEFKERRIIKRYNFDSHFEELKQFVSTLKRFPIQTGSEKEKSIARWICNVLKSNIESTEDQKCLLKEFIAENRTLPQNGTEYNFKQMCDEIKIMVTKTFALPTASDNIREYNWLRKNIEKYTTYEDNRKTYFEDLLSYIRDFGFYL